MGFEATYADFSVDPALLANVEVGYHGARFAGSHLALGAGDSVTLNFEVEDVEDVPQATLTVTALVSKLGSSLGHAPMSIVLQGEQLATDLIVPGGGDLPQDNVFAVPGHLLKPGTNTLEIRSSEEAKSTLWLYRITLDPVFERGRSERARMAEAARDTVFTYYAQLRPAHSATASWQPAPRLFFHIDREERSLPAQLGWRTEDGVEAAIGFQSNMSDFHGCYRAADGTVYEYRGRLTDRRPYSDTTTNQSTATLHRFATEEYWGDNWHAANELRLMVDDGGAPVERVTWRDQQGNSGVAVLHTHSTEADIMDVEASDEYVDADEVAENLLNNDQYSKWLALDVTADLDFELAHPTAIGSYSLMSANDFPQRDPRDWTLYGSHDGRTWTPLDSRKGESFGRRFETRTFHLHTSVRAYSHYRLAITGNSGESATQLAQVRFNEAPGGKAFTGYYQRHNEGPIGYRGTPLTNGSSPASRVAPRVASELDSAVANLNEAAQTLAALADQLRGY